MIFVTVGTQKFQFDRLLKWIDELINADIIKENVVAQIGYSSYSPKNLTTFKMNSPEKMMRYIQESSLVITHGGTSSIIQSINLRKKVIVVPRLKRYKEHIDNHQIEVANLFYHQNLVELANSYDELRDKIELVPHQEYKHYKFDNSQLLNSIKDFLNHLRNEKVNGYH